MSHNEQLPSLNEQFNHLKSQLPVKPERQRWKQELDSLARDICKELSAQGQVPLMERWSEDMIKIFGVGYTQKSRNKPLNICIQNAHDYSFVERSLKMMLNTLHDPSRTLFSSPGDTRTVKCVLAATPKELQSALPSRFRANAGPWSNIVPRRTQAQSRPSHSLSHRVKISSRQLGVYGLSSCEKCGKSRRGGEGGGTCFV